MRRLLPLLLAALALAACGSENSGSGGGGGGGAASASDARELLDRGFATDVDSGRVLIDLSAELRGDDVPAGPLRLTMRGPFSSNGPTRMPNVDWKVEFEGAGETVETRFVTLRDNAFVEYEGEAYEVGQDVWRQFLDKSGGGKGSTSFSQIGLDPLDWVVDARVEGQASVSGAQTTEVAGTLDVRAMLEQVNAYARKLPNTEAFGERQIDAVVDTVKEIEFRAWIGDDDIWRRFTTSVDFELPASLRGEANGLRGGELDVDARLEQPNEPQRIRALPDASPISGLLRELGIPPEVLLGPGARAPEPG